MSLVWPVTREAINEEISLKKVSDLKMALQGGARGGTRDDGG